VSLFTLNKNPTASETGVDGDKTIDISILSTTDDFGVVLSDIDAYVDGNPAFVGPGTFLSPWNGSDSSISAITTDGYSGYKLILDYASGSLNSNTDFSVRVVARDENLNTLDESYSFRTGNKIISAEVSDFEIVLNVKFEQAMSEGTLSKASGYTFDNGAYVRLVEQVSSAEVKIWVELLDGSDSFVLNTSDIILDSYGDPIPSSYNNFVVSPLVSTATISHSNAKIRTWRESNIIFADSERIYLAGSRGMDVFNRDNITATSRWGQIFDSYGINAMFVANFGGDLVITDTSPPYLSNQSPVPLTFAPTDSLIILSIVDDETSVEPTSTTIYINEILAFSGSFGGWQNDYTGSIIVSHKRLNFTIVSVSQFSEGQNVTVRVISSDLYGNELDTIYGFIATDEVDLFGEGFGAEAWGTSGWGSA